MRIDEQKLPLEDYRLFRTDDLGQARDIVGRVFCDHRLDRIGRGHFDALHHHAPVRNLSLNYLEYGAKTSINPGCLDNFYLLQIPLKGSADIANGDQHFSSHQGMAALLNPTRESNMIWEEGCGQLIVQVHRKAMEARIQTLLGTHLSAPLEFAGGVDLTGQGGQGLLALVQFMTAEAEARRLSPDSGKLAATGMEDAFLNMLLECQPHNYSALLSNIGNTIAPWYIRKAEEYIEANVRLALTLEDIAGAAGISARALQLGFRKYRNDTPMGWLKKCRLKKAHEELISGWAKGSVTDIALRWGFSHLGRFSIAYKEEFGCTPRETMQAARGNQFQL